MSLIIFKKLYDSKTTRIIIQYNQKKKAVFKRVANATGVSRRTLTNIYMCIILNKVSTEISSISVKFSILKVGQLKCYFIKIRTNLLMVWFQLIDIGLLVRRETEITLYDAEISRLSRFKGRCAIFIAVYSINIWLWLVDLLNIAFDINSINIISLIQTIILPNFVHLRDCNSL